MSDPSIPRVAILMGSDSDLPVMAEAARVLEGLGIPFELEVTSAHRTPERTVEIVRSTVKRGVQVFIVGAGMAAHLAGVVAAHTTRPVLGVPLSAGVLDGMDALLATVQMPAGVPVGTFAIGKAGAANAAWMAASILALSDQGLADQLTEHRLSMAAKVESLSESAKKRLPEFLGG
jgi:phosphoribosylaminoimidazole carboxylase PurE protein